MKVLERLSDKRMSHIQLKYLTKMFDFMAQYVVKFGAAFKKPIQLLSRK